MEVGEGGGLKVKLWVAYAWDDQSPVIVGICTSPEKAQEIAEEQHEVNVQEVNSDEEFNPFAWQD